MKPFTQYLCICLMLFSTLNVCAQDKNTEEQQPAISKDLVIQLPGVDNGKLLPVLKQKLKTIEGITYNGFCESRQLLFLTTISDTDEVFELFQTMHLEYSIKQNASLQRAMLECVSQSEIENSLSIE